MAKTSAERARLFRLRHPNYAKEQSALWYKTHKKERKQYSQKYWLKWSARNKKKRAEYNKQRYVLIADTEHLKLLRSAHLKVQKAVRKGEIIKPVFCSFCGLKLKLQAHHPDYSKPLAVLWLCQSCHSLEHKRLSKHER